MALAREILRNTKLLSLCNTPHSPCLQNSCYIVMSRAKHYNPKFRWLRGQKMIPIELPDDTANKGKSSKEAYRSKLKRMGIYPYAKTIQRPMTLTTATEIFDPYVPPEGDGKASLLTKEGAAVMVEGLKKKQKTWSAIRTIKNYDGDFDVKIFPQHAHDIYVKAHTVLMKKDPELLSEYATERANVEMFDGIKNSTIRWKFIESLEPPVIVHARCEAILVKTNFFAQITVRFHTKQSLAVYDRFGRLTYGSEILAKDVLEYVIFEKHITNVYGTWRIHAKIIPDWMAPSAPVPRTYRIETAQEEEEDEENFIQEDQDLSQQDLEEEKEDEKVQKKN